MVLIHSCNGQIVLFHVIFSIIIAFHNFNKPTCSFSSIKITNVLASPPDKCQPCPFLRSLMDLVRGFIGLQNRDVQLEECLETILLRFWSHFYDVFHPWPCLGANSMSRDVSFSYGSRNSSFASSKTSAIRVGKSSISNNFKIWQLYFVDLLAIGTLFSWNFEGSEILLPQTVGVACRDFDFT